MLVFGLKISRLCPHAPRCDTPTVGQETCHICINTDPSLEFEPQRRPLALALLHARCYLIFLRKDIFSRDAAKQCKSILQALCFFFWAPRRSLHGCVAKLLDSRTDSNPYI